jgi:predicted GIY-YIG superfamily endonuclease
MSKSYVYLLLDGMNYKIGITTNMDNRIKELQTGNSRNISVVFYYPINSAQKMEAMLHRKYKKKRVRGEWFNLNQIDVNHIEFILKEVSGRVR